MNLSTMPLMSIVSLCRREQTKHRKQEPYTDIYCVELFRRALETPFTEEAGNALIHIKAIFDALANSWVRRHWRYQLIRERTTITSDMFVDDGLSRMWTAFANKVKAGKPYTMDSLSTLLAYWKLAIYTAIERFPFSNEEPPDTELPDTTVVSEDNEILAHYLDCLTKCRAVRSEKELAIFYARYLLEMPPRSIYEEYTVILELENIKEVQSILDAIKSRIKGKKIYACLEACIDGFDD